MTTRFNLPSCFKKEQDYKFTQADGFSYVEYRHCREPGNNQILLTAHMLVVIFSGTKMIHSKASSFTIEQGDAFFAQKGSYIGSERLSLEKGNFESLMFFFEDNFLIDFIRKNVDGIQLNLRDGAISARAPKDQSGIFLIKVAPLLKSCIESVLPYFTQTGPRTRSILRLKFEEILLNILDADKDLSFHKFLKDLKQNWKKDIAEVVEQNLINPVTIEELAKLAGRSLTTFKRDFRNIYKEPPRTWINKKRIERAHTILKTTNRNITDVCYDTGFSSISHFIQLFKNTYGITPKQFQKDQMR